MGGQVESYRKYSMAIAGWYDKPGFANNSTNRPPFDGWKRLAEAQLLMTHAVSRPRSVPATARTGSCSGTTPASTAIKTHSKHTNVPVEINSNVFARISREVTCW